MLYLPCPSAPFLLLTLRLKAEFDESQRRRIASLGQKLLRAFRRQQARNWSPPHGGDRQLSIVYGPCSSWGKREAQNLRRERSMQLRKVREIYRRKGGVAFEGTGVRGVITSPFTRVSGKLRVRTGTTDRAPRRARHGYGYAPPASIDARGYCTFQTRASPRVLRHTLMNVLLTSFGDATFTRLLYHLKRAFGLRPRHRPLLVCSYMWLCLCVFAVFMPAPAGLPLSVFVHLLLFSFKMSLNSRCLPCCNSAVDCENSRDWRYSRPVIAGSSPSREQRARHRIESKINKSIPELCIYPSE